MKQAAKGTPGEVMAVATEIKWLTNEPEVLDEATRTGKPIVIDFKSPG